jgi:hypothetical protein
MALANGNTLFFRIQVQQKYVGSTSCFALLYSLSSPRRAAPRCPMSCPRHSPAASRRAGRLEIREKKKSEMCTVPCQAGSVLTEGPLNPRCSAARGTEGSQQALPEPPAGR